MTDAVTIANRTSGDRCAPVVMDLSGNKAICLLHPHTYMMLLYVCAAVFVALPVACGIVWLVGGAALVVGTLVLVVVVIVTYVLCIGGVVLAMLSLFGGEDGVPGIIGGVLAAGVGLAIKGPVDSWHQEWPTTCNHAIDIMQTWSSVLVNGLFVGYHICWLAWIPLCVLMAAGFWMTFAVHIVNCAGRMRRRLRGVRYTCTRCDRDQVLSHQCPTCKSLINGLAMSSKGMLSTPCPACASQLPTTRISGRSQLKQCCKHCGHDSHPIGWGNCRETTVLNVDLDNDATGDCAAPEVCTGSRRITYIHHMTGGDLLQEDELNSRQVMANVARVVLNIDACRSAYRITHKVSTLITVIECAQRISPNRRSRIAVRVSGRGHKQLSSHPNYEAIRNLLHRRFRSVGWS